MTVRDYVGGQIKQDVIDDDILVTIQTADEDVIGFMTAEDVLTSGLECVDYEYVESDKDELTGGLIIVVEDTFEI